MNALSNVFMRYRYCMCMCISCDVFCESCLSLASAAVLWWWCSCSSECTVWLSGVEVILLTVYWLCVLALLVPSPAQPILYWCSRNMSFWSSISFNLAVLMNLLVAFFYPLEGIRGGQWVLSSFSPTLSLPQLNNLQRICAKRWLISVCVLCLILQVWLLPNRILKQMTSTDH